MPPKFENSGKKMLLQKTLSEKDLLFGKFDESKGITKQSRLAAWDKIHKEMASLGFPVGKNGKHVRDTTFANLKKRTLVSYHPHA